MGLWNLLFSFESIGIILLIIAAIYFTVTTKGRQTDSQSLPFSWEEGLSDIKFKPLKHRRPGYQGRGMGKNEERCREIFETLFGVPFPSVRPAFLKNPATGKPLELDGFNADIETPLGNGLAFEYDGIQHAAFNPHFHRGDENEFKYQFLKDELKDKLCRQNGIVLIRIPHHVPYVDLDRYIKSRCEEENIL
jgi:hypothetical protein